VVCLQAKPCTARSTVHGQYGQCEGPHSALRVTLANVNRLLVLRLRSAAGHFSLTHVNSYVIMAKLVLTSFDLYYERN